jgi:hypothetical protein
MNHRLQKVWRYLSSGIHRPGVIKNFPSKIKLGMGIKLAN